MRITSLKALTGFIILAAIIAAPANRARGQALIGITEANWQYYDIGNEPSNPSQPGLKWNMPNFNDSSWNPGVGVHGYETSFMPYPIQTPVNRFKSDGTTQVLAYYFRTHFNYTGQTNPLVLNFTNQFDDGAIVYLNGFEIYRYRMTGTPTSNTQATAPAVDNATIEETNILNTPYLLQGDNVLAVEVHQSGTGSSDAVMGVGLGTSLPDQIVITRQPPSRIEAVAFDDVTMSVDVTGTAPRYWWFFNTNILVGQNPVLTRNNIQFAQAGTYHVVVSNSFSGARSSNVVVTVVPDTFGPRILDAYVGIGETNRLLLQFNEDINRFPASNPIAGANTNNYFVSILNQPANRIDVSLAQVAFGNGQVRLTLETNFNFSTNYQICISNITDLRTNTIAWNSCVPIGFQTVTNPIPYQSFWFYHPWPFEPEGGDWKAVNYFEDPSRWAEGQGAFFGSFSDTNHAVCSSLGNSLDVGYTSYFRKKFVMATNLVGVKMDVTLGHAIDDGAVFYLNGTELTRYNMPAGPVVYDTRASTAVNNECRTTTFSDLVFARTNILAVELHQNNPGSVQDLDAGFEASLSLRYILYPRFTQPTNIRIRATNHSPTHVSIYFTNGFGYAIQSKTNLTDPWQEVQPVTNRLITPKANPRRFYRLQKSH